MLRQFAAAMLMLTAAERRCTSPLPRPIELGTAAAFRDSVGVNVHLQYTETAYGDRARVDAALTYLGVTHLRDSAMRRGPAMFDHFVDLARRGERFDLFFNAELDPQLARAAALQAAALGAIALIEGPNEINNDPVSFQGRTGLAGAQAYQAALYDQVRSRPEFRTLPVLNYTNYPASSGRADAVNVHSYAKRGASPGGQLASDSAQTAAAMAPGLPTYVTEIGYTTAPAAASPDAVSLDDQAALTLVALLDAFRAGVRRTYLYELLDERADGPTSGDPEHHYGLFDAEGRPKPAATAIQAILKLLPAGNFSASPQDLPVAAHFDGQGARMLLLRGGVSGSVLFVWRETVPGALPESVEMQLSDLRTVRQVSLTGQTSNSVPTRRWRIWLERSPAVFLLTAPPQPGRNKRPLAPSQRPIAMLR